MKERVIQSGDATICTESFGDITKPAILLIMGATASMIWWEEQFCERLAHKGFFVIRYDNRDVGRSTCYKPGEPPSYTVLEMASDALAVLDAYSVDRAHLAGMSLGGMLAQIIAIQHPERVLSITLISSSVWDNLPELPQIDNRVLEYHSSAATLDWTNQEATIQYMVGGWKLISGSKHPFEEKRVSELVRTDIERANNILSMFNHSMLSGGDQLFGRSNEITAPTLIIHGTEDIVLSFAHAEATHKIIPNSRLLALEGRGHEIHPLDWDLIIEALYKNMQLAKFNDTPQ